MFKFTFFGIEFSRYKKQIKERNDVKMSHHRLTKQQKKFQKCVRKAHFNTFHPHSFGRFMGKCLRR